MVGEVFEKLVSIDITTAENKTYTIMKSGQYGNDWARVLSGKR